MLVDALQSDVVHGSIRACRIAQLAPGRYAWTTDEVNAWVRTNRFGRELFDNLWYVCVLVWFCAGLCVYVRLCMLAGLWVYVRM